MTHCLTPRSVKAADAQPDDFVHEFCQFRIGLIFKRDGHELLHSGGARVPGEFQRQRAVAGDEAEGCGRGVHLPEAE
jgi:hypothetical protein